MNIAVTPRVGVNTRRSEDRLKAENDLLLTLPTDGTSAALADDPGRNRLIDAKFVECTSPKTRPTLWRLTWAGLARVGALRRRRP